MLHLFNFFVRLVGPAERTELAHLKTLGGGLLILRLAVILAFALCALERDNFSRHRPLPRRSLGRAIKSGAVDQD